LLFIEKKKKREIAREGEYSFLKKCLPFPFIRLASAKEKPLSNEEVKSKIGNELSKTESLS